MSGLSDYAENLLLNWLLTTEAAPASARPTAWWVALHDGDPGDTGANEVVVGTDANYARKTVTFADAVAGASLSELQVAWTAAAGATTHTVTHVSIWDALTTGNCLLSGPLLAPKLVEGSTAWAIEIGELIAALS